jgi:hypothetical protein
LARFEVGSLANFCCRGRFLLGAGVAICTIKHLAANERNQLLVELLSSEAVTTSAIEGEVLNRASVQSAILRQLGLTSACCLGQPILVSLATTILTHQRSYYEALERANRRNDVTQWLIWFAALASLSLQLPMYSSLLDDGIVFDQSVSGQARVLGNRIRRKSESFWPVEGLPYT